MPIFLHIKGDRAAAMQALDARGFNPADRLTEIATYTPSGMSHGYVVSDVNVKDECLPGVTRWFVEEVKAPYPPGSLLHYSVRVS